MTSSRQPSIRGRGRGQRHGRRRREDPEKAHGRRQRPSAVIDFVGSEPSSALALASLRKGGKLIVVGMYGGELRFPLPFCPCRPADRRCTWAAFRDMDELMALVREGRIPPDAPRQPPTGEAGAILAGLKAGQIRGRAVLSYEG